MKFGNVASNPNFPLCFQAKPSSDQTTSSPSPVFMLKYERNPRFVDRPDVFRALCQTIEASKESGRCKPVAICGLGGMGKSQIALEFCYRNEGNYPYIFWTDADKGPTLQSSFESMARTLELATNYTDPESVRSKMIQWLQNNDRWLLV